MLNTPIDRILTEKDNRFIIYKLLDKLGLIVTSEKQLDAQFDEIKEMGHGRFFLRKGSDWAALKWEE